VLLGIPDTLSKNLGDLEMPVEQKVFFTGVIGSLRASARHTIATSEMYIEAVTLMTGAPPPEPGPNLRVIDCDEPPHAA
jgi:hypothetical protein